jgi:hypothetical protein
VTEGIVKTARTGVTRHDEAVRRFVIALGGLFLVIATGAVAVPGPSPAGAAPALHTVAGQGGVGRLSAPSGFALDSSGDLFIADTDHCRVLLLPSHAGAMYGMHVQVGHSYTVAGGTSCAGGGGIGFPTGVAVDHRGDVFIAIATGQRIFVVRPGGTRRPRAPALFAGTGEGGYSGDGQTASQSMLNEPTGIAVDTAGDLFIADSGNCRVRMVPSSGGIHLGQVMEADHLYTVAGTGSCGSSGRGEGATSAEVDEPVAVAVDGAGDLFVADRGDDDVLEVPVSAGIYYGTSIGGDDLAVIAGMGGNGPYLTDGLGATSEVAELNDPEGVAVDARGDLFVADGAMHSIRVVPSASATVLGQRMSGGDMYTVAGALTVQNASGGGDGTRWVRSHMDVPIGVAVTGSGHVYFSDRGLDQVRELQ